MAEFVLNRNHLMITRAGFTVHFKKGEPTFVPTPVIKDAIAIGATRIDAEQGAEFDVTPAPPEPTAQEREETLVSCMRSMAEKNIREDFTAQGVPHLKAVEKYTGIVISGRERDALWDTYRAQEVEKEAQQ